MFKKGQMVTIIKPNDSFYNIIGRIVEIKSDEVTIDLRYIKRTYKFSEIKPIIEGYAK